MKLLVHPLVEAQIRALVAAPGGTVLLHGPRHVGKFTAAQEIARQLNCAKVAGGACTDGSCRSCRKLAGGNHPNLTLVQPDDKNKIGVEPIHELQHGLHYGQYEAPGRRVVIIRGADRLTLPAQNALLKTLEEPPSGTTIIMTAEEPTALLPTVLSRCRQLFLPRLPVKVIAEFLQRGAGGAVAAAEANRLAAASHGLPGRAVTYRADADGLAQDGQRAAQVRRFLDAATLFERLQLAAQIASATAERADYLAELTDQVRSAARQGMPQAARQLAGVGRLQQHLQANVNPKTAFEALAVELA